MIPATHKEIILHSLSVRLFFPAQYAWRCASFPILLVYGLFPYNDYSLRLWAARVSIIIDLPAEMEIDYANTKLLCVSEGSPQGG